MRRPLAPFGVVRRKPLVRNLLLATALVLLTPLVLASQVAASPAKSTEAAMHVAGSPACTTIHVLRHGTKVVTVRGTKVVSVWKTKVVRVHVRHHGRLVWIRRRVRHRHRKRVVYRHRKRVVYSFRVPKKSCPPPSPTVSLEISTKTLPSSGGTVTLTYSATSASSCTLDSSPAFGSLTSATSVNCDGSYTSTVGPSRSQQSWTFVFIGTSANAAGRVVETRAVQTLTEQAPAPVSPPASPVSSGGSGGGGSSPPSPAPPPPPPPPTNTALAITTSTLPGATVGDAYAAQLAASGGTPPYTWAVTGGALPNGLGLLSSGELTGTATTAGTASFTVQVTDSSAPTHATASTSLSITVALPPFPGLRSTNWSGYIWPSASVVTGVGATWTVPTLDCSATPNAGMGSWIGTGGAGGSSGDLLQTGIASTCVNGLQNDVGWWEEYPEVAQTNFSGFPVSPGDVVEASAYQDTSGNWDTRLCDVTSGLAGVMITGQSWGVGPDPGCTASTVTYTFQGSATGISYSGGYTGEWIVEDPAAGATAATAQEVPFADFGSVSFTNMGLAPGPWSGGISDPQNDVELVEGGQILAVPSWPGAGMTVTYTG